MKKGGGSRISKHVFVHSLSGNDQAGAWPLFFWQRAVQGRREGARVICGRTRTHAAHVLGSPRLFLPNRGRDRPQSSDRASACPGSAHVFFVPAETMRGSLLWLRTEPAPFLSRTLQA